MAKTVCLKCDNTYNKRLERCPHCNTWNFFSDMDTVVPAVNILCAQMKTDAAEQQREKLRELAALRPTPWWKRWLLAFWNFTQLS